MSSNTTRTSPISCPWAGCRERNRPEAVFCAQCGRVLDPVEGFRGDGFVRGTEPHGWPEHLSELLCWGLAVCGAGVLACVLMAWMARLAH